MQYADWHSCKRWWDRGWKCPYEEEEEHDDDEEEERDAKEKRDQLGDTAEDLYYAFDRLRKERTKASDDIRKIKKPLRDVTPIRELQPTPIRKPLEVPPIAAYKRSGKWLRTFKNALSEMPARAVQATPVRALSPAPSSTPVKRTVTLESKAKASERALTRSLPIYTRAPKPWDTGVVTPAMSRDAPRSLSRQRKGSRYQGDTRSGRQKAEDFWNKYTPHRRAAAAAILTGIGVRLLSQRFGGGGGTSQSPKFRGGSERGAEWAIP